MSTKQGLELALLISGDDVVPGVQAPALPAALIEVENPAGLLREVGIAREYRGAPRPRPDRVLRQIAPDRGARDRADDPALDSLSRDLSVRPARQRSTRLGRKLAGQRFDLRDLCGGKTTGAGQASASARSHTCWPLPTRSPNVMESPSTSPEHISGVTTSQPTSRADPPRLRADSRRDRAHRRRGSRGPPARPRSLATCRAGRAPRPTP